MVQGNSQEYEGSKTWKHVESIDGTLHSAAIPEKSLSSCLIGVICGTTAHIPEFWFSHHDDGSVHVSAHHNGECDVI